MTSFGTLLRGYRVAAGLTQEELAERAQMSVRGVSYLEKDARQPYRDTVRRLAVALHLDASQCAALEASLRPSGEAHAGPGDAPLSRTGSPAHGRAPLLPLVGRVQELAILERHLAGQGPPVLLLAGEPGIGKTRLLREVLEQSENRGWCVLHGGCQRRNGQPPFAPLLDALDQYLIRRSPAQLRDDLRGCAWLVRLLPELAGGPIEPLPDWSLPAEQERRLMDKAVRRVLANVAGAVGTLLVLDDLQWAGADALDLLVTLVRATEEPALRVIGAYRDTDVQDTDPLARVLADLAHAGLATQHTLAPLSASEVGQLLRVLLEEQADQRAELQERVVQRTGGVPFFVVSCAQLLYQSAGERGEEEADAVPWDVAQGIRQRVAALPAATREMLSMAAVLGRVVWPSLLISASEQDERTVLTGLETASRARLLVEEEGRYQFTHDLIREVVEGEIGVARRARLHQRIAEALEREPGEVAVDLLAYHYGRSGSQDKAQLYRERAGDRAYAQAAHAAAAAYYREVVTHLDTCGRSGEAARVREKLGAVLATAGHFEAALVVVERAAQTYRAAQEQASLVRTTARIGWLHSRCGRVDTGIASLQPVIASVPAGEDAAALRYALATAQAALANLYFMAGRYREQLATAQQAAALAREARNDKALAEALETQGQALMLLVGSRAAAEAVVQEACDVAESAGELYQLYFALMDLTMIARARGQAACSRAYMERAHAVARQHGDAVQIAGAGFFQALLAFDSGEWSQAHRACAQTVALCRQVGTVWILPLVCCLLGRLHLAVGEREAAVQAWADGLALAEGPTGASLWGRRWLHNALAELDVQEGRPTVASTRLLPLLDRPDLEETEVTPLLVTLAWAHLEAGDMAQARTVIARALRRLRADDDRRDLVSALGVQARVALAHQQWVEARRDLDEGLELARDMGHPYAEARLLEVYGELYLRSGEPAMARARLDDALAKFQRLDARLDVGRVQQAIACTGR